MGLVVRERDERTDVVQIGRIPEQFLLPGTEGVHTGLPGREEEVVGQVLDMKGMGPVDPTGIA